MLSKQGVLNALVKERIVKKEGHEWNGNAMMKRSEAVVMMMRSLIWRGHEGEGSGKTNQSAATVKLVPALRDLVELMKAALQEAISDAEGAEEVTYHGYDGRLLSRSGGRCTYQITLRTYWDIDDNARIVVKNLAGTTKADARVISHEATSLMLVTQSLLDGEFLPHLLLIEDRTWLLKKQLHARRSQRDDGGIWCEDPQPGSGQKWEESGPREAWQFRTASAPEACDCTWARQ